MCFAKANANSALDKSVHVFCCLHFIKCIERYFDVFFTVGSCDEIGTFSERFENQILGTNLPVLIAYQG